MEFKIDGKKVKPTVGYDVVRIKKILDKLPDGEMLSAVALAEKLNLAAAHLRDNIVKKLPENYIKLSHKVYYASEKTIKAYRAQL